MTSSENSSEESDYRIEPFETESVEDSDESADEHEGVLDGDSNRSGSESSDESVESDDDTTEAVEKSPQGTEDPARTEKKEVRGITRMLKLFKKWDGKKHVIEFDRYGRFKGKYKSEIASYMGVLVRRDVGLRYLKWKVVPPELKEKLWEQIVVSNSLISTLKFKYLLFTSTLPVTNLQFIFC